MDQIYIKRKPPYSIKDYRSFFTKLQTGFNPLEIDAMMDFEKFDPTTILKNQFKKFKREKLNTGLIIDYFDTDNKNLNKFNKDINFGFKKIRLNNKWVKPSKMSLKLAK